MSEVLAAAVKKLAIVLSAATTVAAVPSAFNFAVTVSATTMIEPVVPTLALAASM